MLDTHACFRPEKRVTVPEAIALACDAIRFARENGIGRLLVDSTRLTGLEPPTTAERYELGERLAAEAMGKVKLAMLARPELIHPRHFAVLVGRNRGLQSEVFDSESEAIAWLLGRR